MGVALLLLINLQVVVFLAVVQPQEQVVAKQTYLGRLPRDQGVVRAVAKED